MKFWRHFNLVKRMSSHQRCKMGIYFFNKDKTIQVRFFSRSTVWRNRVSEKKKEPTTARYAVSIYAVNTRFYAGAGLLTTIDRKLLVNLSKKEEYCSTGEKKIDSADTYQRKRVLRTSVFLSLFVYTKIIRKYNTQNFSDAIGLKQRKFPSNHLNFCQIAFFSMRKLFGAYSPVGSPQEKNGSQSRDLLFSRCFLLQFLRGTLRKSFNFEFTAVNGHSTRIYPSFCSKCHNNCYLTSSPGLHIYGP